MDKFFARHKLLIPKLTQEEMNRPITIKGTESEVAQSCLTLSDPMDCSSPGSSVHGIFQARTLEWVAISFSNAWKWKVKVKLLSRVRLSAIPWTAAYQAPPSNGIFQARVLEWVAISFPNLSEFIKMFTKNGCILLYVNYTWVSQLKTQIRAYLVAQQLRLCQPMQEIRVQSLVREDPTCRRATKPMHHNYWACALQPGNRN